MKTKLLSLAFFFFFLIGTSLAQNPPHPNGGNGTTGGNPVGGGAPIGGGLLILSALGIGYGVSKIYRMRRNYQDLMDS